MGGGGRRGGGREVELVDEWGDGGIQEEFEGEAGGEI